MSAGDHEERGSFEEGIDRLSSRGGFDKAMVATSLFAGFASLASEWSRIEDLAERIGDFLQTLFLTQANAASSSAGAATATGSSIGPYLSTACVLGVFLILLGCLWHALFSARPESDTAKSWDLIKLISGFFIGTLTT